MNIFTFTNRNPKTGEVEINNPTISVDLHTYDDVSEIIEDHVNNQRPWHHPMGVEGYGQDISIRHLLHIGYDTMKRLRMSEEFSDAVEMWIADNSARRESYREKLIADVQKSVTRDLPEDQKSRRNRVARTITVNLNIPDGYEVDGETTISESEIDKENKRVFVIIEYPIIEHIPVEEFRSKQKPGKETEELRNRIRELEELAELEEKERELRKRLGLDKEDLEELS